MDTEGFRSYLREREISKGEIETAISIVERFEGFLNRSGRSGSLETATSKDVYAFSTILIEEGNNTYGNYLAVARCAQFVRNHPLYIAVLELLDGSEVFGNLSEKLIKEFGEETRGKVFDGVGIPLLGTPNAQKPPLTQIVIEQLECTVGPETCRRILGTGLRTLPDVGYLSAKQKYEESGSVDAYLKRKGEEFIVELEKIKREDGLFFTQEITEDVIDFVRSHPEILQGVREGNVVYETKIPYMTKQYLAETGERMKAYYYCHCPWVRESLRIGNATVPAVFCNCSAAFHKKPWEVIFGRSLEADVVETVLNGDSWCRFAIHLPDDVI